MIDARYLKECVHYDPETGIFTYKDRPRSHFSTPRACNAWNAKLAGKVTGCRDTRGHIQVKIDGRKYSAHGLAFLYMEGNIPALIDHRDRDKTNNAWRNLRPATQSQNAGNNGAKGVYPTKSGRFRAQICVNYRIRHLGTFDGEAEARSAYMRASAESFGEYSPHSAAVTGVGR